MLSLNALPQNALPQLGRPTPAISSQQPHVLQENLTPREKECLLWAAEGKTTGETSQILSIAERTVHFHLQNAAAKLQVSNPAHTGNRDLRRRNPNEGGTFGRQVIGLQDDKPQSRHVLEFKPSAPVQFIVKLLEIWELDLDSACTLLGYEKSSRSHVQAILSGAVPLETRDEKDRIAELFVIRKILHSVFRDRKVENQWLREPQSLLDGSSPLDLLLEGSWPNLLRVRQFTELMAGL